MTNARTNSRPSPLPTTIWLPGPHDENLSPVSPAVLPDWAINKIRA
ncbi:hypothetical protein ACWGNF_28375 [Streptomyces sp. NPDC055808]